MVSGLWRLFFFCCLILVLIVILFCLHWLLCMSPINYMWLCICKFGEWFFLDPIDLTRDVEIRLGGKWLINVDLTPSINWRASLVWFGVFLIDFIGGIGEIWILLWDDGSYLAIEDVASHVAVILTSFYWGFHVTTWNEWLLDFTWVYDCLLGWAKVGVQLVLLFSVTWRTHWGWGWGNI